MIVAAIVATYTLANGLCLWPLLLISGLLLRINTRHLAALAVAAIAFGGAYFVGYRFSSDSHPANLITHPIYTAKFIAAYLGMPFTVITDAPAVPTLGITIGFFNLMSVLTLAVFAWRRGMLLSRPGIVLFGTYAFTLAAIVFTAVGRMNPADPDFVAASAARYITAPLLNWAVTFFICFWFAGLTKWKGTLVPASAMVLGILLALAFAQLAPWLANQADLFAEHQLCDLSMRSGLLDDDLLRKVFPSADFVKGYLPVLQKNRLSIYYKWQGRWLGKNAMLYGGFVSERTPGVITLLYPVTGGVEILGWADESRLRRSYKWVLIVDELMKVVGFGEKLPAGFPRSLTDMRTPSSLAWVGFVNTKFSPKTITAYLVDLRSGLIRIGEPVPVPTVHVASLHDLGALIQKVDWSGEEASDAARLPMQLSVGVPGGPVHSTWHGSDANTGTWQSSVFSAPKEHCLIMPVIHGPTVAGLAVTLLDGDLNAVIAEAPMLDSSQSWNFWRIPVPENVHRLRITASDEGRGWGQWVAVSDPTQCR
jgi:hypothetical protein